MAAVISLSAGVSAPCTVSAAVTPQMTVIDGSRVGESGKCGDNAEWKYENGKLTITGYGNMDNWEMSDDTPWSKFKKQISSAEIDGRITSVGACAFADTPNLRSITIPSGVTKIGRGAFDTCPGLGSVDVPAACTSIGMGAFRNCSSMQKVTIRNKDCDINLDKETISSRAGNDTASYNGVIEGYGDGTMRPNEPITREQIAAVYMRYSAWKGYSTGEGADTSIPPFPDYDDISKWAIPYVQWAVGAGLMVGRDDNGVPYLTPPAGTMRSEAATLQMRFCEKYGI